MCKRLFALLIVLTVSLFSFSVSAQAADVTEIDFPYTSSDGLIFDDIDNAVYGVPSPSQVLGRINNLEGDSSLHFSKYISYIVFRGIPGSRTETIVWMFGSDNPDLNVNLSMTRAHSQTYDIIFTISSSSGENFYCYREYGKFDNTSINSYSYSGVVEKNKVRMTQQVSSVQPNVYIYSDFPFTINGSLVSGTKPFEPQLNGHFEFINGDLRLNVRALTSADFDNRVYLEIYDALPAVEQLIYKPVKYVYPTYDGHSMHVSGHKIDDYLRPTETGLTYSMTADTLHRAGCVSDNPYNAYAYCYDDNGKPFEICHLQFAFAGDDFYTYIDTDGDGAPDVQQIAEKGEDGKYTNNYYDVDTGEKLDPNNLSYNFGYGLEEPASNVYDGTPDYDFDVEISNDIMQGAGLVRTIFDKIIDKSGLSGFLITLLAISIASWFIFGRRA